MLKKLVVQQLIISREFNKTISQIEIDRIDVRNFRRIMIYLVTCIA